MSEIQEIINPDNYKILIQQKFNRVKRTKCKYVTSELTFVENENEALEFKNFSEAEKFLSTFFPAKNQNPKPRIIVKYKLEKDETLAKSFKE